MGLDVQAICANFSVQLWFDGEKRHFSIQVHPKLNHLSVKKVVLYWPKGQVLKGQIGQIAHSFDSLQFLCGFVFLFVFIQSCS